MPRFDYTIDKASTRVMSQFKQQFRFKGIKERHAWTKKIKNYNILSDIFRVHGQHPRINCRASLLLHAVDEYII